MRVYVTDHDGKEHELEALDGWRVMEVIRDWELPIKAECGGACACATCHSYIDEGWLTLEGDRYVVPVALRPAVVSALPLPGPPQD